MRIARAITAITATTIVLAVPSVTGQAAAQAGECLVNRLICSEVVNAGDVRLKVRGTKGEPSTDRWVNPGRHSPFADTDQFRVPAGKDVLLHAGEMFPVRISATGWHDVPFDRPVEWELIVVPQG